MNSSRSAYIMAKDGTRIRQRVAVNDLRGHIAELLAKALDQGSLDTAISAADKARLRPFLEFYGDLGKDGRFTGTARSGLSHLPGAGVTFAEAGSALPLEQLLANDQLPLTLFDEFAYMQATMVEPVGGMDRIHAGFDRNLRHPAIRGAVVTRIRHGAKGVDVTWRDAASGAVDMLHADYLICTIPFAVLKDIDTDFVPATKAAIASVMYDYSNKIAFEAPRFWEKEQIYGGISFVGGPTGLVWYPSAGLHSARGMLLACYSSGPDAAAFEKRPIAEQIDFARGVVERLHPGHGQDLVNGIAVNWHKVPFSLGAWPDFTGGKGLAALEPAIDTPYFRRLLEPDGRVLFRERGAQPDAGLAGGRHRVGPRADHRAREARRGRPARAQGGHEPCPERRKPDAYPDRSPAPRQRHRRRRAGRQISEHPAGADPAGRERRAEVGDALSGRGRSRRRSTRRRRVPPRRWRR